MIRGATGLGLLTLVAAGGCDLDTCALLPQGFQLDITVDDELEAEIAALDITLRYDGFVFERTFPVEGALADGRTSVGVELDPSTLGETRVDIVVIAYEDLARERPVGETSEGFDISDDACNQLPVELESIDTR